MCVSHCVCRGKYVCVTVCMKGEYVFVTVCMQGKSVTVCMQGKPVTVCMQGKHVSAAKEACFCHCVQWKSMYRGNVFSSEGSSFCRESFIIYSKFGKDSFGCCRLSALLVFPLSIVSVAIYEVIHFKMYPCSVKRSVPVISKFWIEKNKKIILVMTEINDLGEIRTACGP